MNKVVFKRNLSPFSVLSLALGSIIGWGAFVLPGDSFLLEAGPMGVTLGFLLSALMLVILVYNYSYMTNLFPKAGGEFIYAKKIFNTKHGFFCSWFLSLAHLSIIPLNATALALLVSTLSGNFLKFGFLYSIDGFDVFFGEILLSFTILTICAYFCYSGIKISGILQNMLIVMLISGILILSLSLFLSDDIVMSSINPLFSPKNSEFKGILLIISFAPWAFIGFQTIPQAAEEFNFSTRKIRTIMIWAIMWGTLVYIILSLLIVFVIPERFENWYSYIQSHFYLKGIESLPVFFASHRLLNDVGLIILGLTVFSAIISGIMGFFIASSRLLYSMAKYKVLPKRFSYLDVKRKTPKNAIFFILIVSMVLSIWGRNALNWLVNMASLGAGIGFIYTTASTIVISRKKKQKGMLVLGILGFIISLMFLGIIIFSLTKESFICLLLWSILGFFHYTNIR